MNKVKKFIKEHDEEIAIAGVLVGTSLFALTSGYILGASAYRDYVGKSHVCIPKNSMLGRVLMGAIEKYPEKAEVFTIGRREELKANDLGELGKAVKHIFGTSDNPGFTHFIAIGPANK